VISIAHESSSVGGNLKGESRRKAKRSKRDQWVTKRLSPPFFIHFAEHECLRHDESELNGFFRREFRGIIVVSGRIMSTTKVTVQAMHRKYVGMKGLSR